MILNQKNEFGLLADSFNKMSKELANSRYVAESIMNALPNILIITDLNLNIKQVNDRACVELGFFKEELINKSFLNVLEDEKIQKSLKNLKEGEVLTKKTFMNIKLNHVPILLSSSVMNLKNSDNNLLVNIIQDMTSIKKMEDNLISASRQAGMADVATSVLHNVGNILNSLKTSILIIDEINKKNSIEGLHKAALLLIHHQNNLSDFFTQDERGKVLPQFFITLFEVFNEEIKVINSEVQLLKKNIDHIDNIITTQQKMSGGYGVKEQFDIIELIDEAININLTFSKRMIRIIKEYKPIKLITIDRVKIMQVIVNLIKNAIESLIEDKKPEKILKIIVKPNNQHSFILQIKDNGIGISPEDLSKIFSFGFTTKKRGHGFGLHASALSIKELHGSLKVTSEGIGKGAIFTLILPYF